jgi:hypothetical protein
MKKVKIPEDNEEPMEGLSLDDLMKGGAKVEKSFEAVEESKPPTLVLESLNKDLGEALQLVVESTNMKVYTPEMIYLQQILRELRDMRNQGIAQQQQRELKVVFKHEK